MHSYAFFRSSTQRHRPYLQWLIYFINLGTSFGRKDHGQSVLLLLSKWNHIEPDKCTGIYRDTQRLMVILRAVYNKYTEVVTVMLQEGVAVAVKMIIIIKMHTKQISNCKLTTLHLYTFDFIIFYLRTNEGHEYCIKFVLSCRFVLSFTFLVF